MSEKTFTTIFGPISSRRLGRSLGVDVIPRKLCSLDCVYCEVGRTDKRGFARKEYIPADLILRELADALSLHDDLDCVTYSGSGEPTLHSRLGSLLQHTHDLTSAPVTVLTNGTLLWQDEVRADLLHADVVCPSLNAVSEDIFRRINRPHPALTAALVLDGLIGFRDIYHGKYYLEILFVKGLNDSEEECRNLQDACARIHPDSIHVNTVVRPPAESWALPVPYERLREIAEMLGPSAEVLIPHALINGGQRRIFDGEEILSLLGRRAMSIQEISACLSADRDAVQHRVQTLVLQGAVRPVLHDGAEYFAVAREAHLT